MFVTVPDSFLKYVSPEPFAGLRALGLDHVDVWVNRELKTHSLVDGEGKPYDLSAAKGVAALKKALAANKVRIWSLSVGTDFGRADQVAEAQWLVRVCQIADELGAPAVRMDPAAWSAKLPEEELLRRITDAVARALDASKKVALGAENHGPIANKQEFLDPMLEMTPSERFGVTLDCGNFYWFGNPLDRVYELVSRYAGRARHTHIKNIGYPAETRQVQREMGWRYGELSCPLPDGDIDLKRVVATLAKAGYDGALTVEDESLGRLPREDAARELKRDVEYLKSVVP